MEARQEMLIGAIQSGGRSSRMGEDKAWLEIDNQWMIELVIQAASPLLDKLWICAGDRNRQDSRYDRLAKKWDSSLLHDVAPEKGPLGGILSALRQFQGDGIQIFVLACDLPFLETPFLGLVRDIHNVDRAEITVPLDQTGRPQPLAAIYNGSCLQFAEEHFAQGRLRVDLLFDRVTTRKIEYHEYNHLSGAEWFLSNVNSPQDLESARDHMGKSHQR